MKEQPYFNLNGNSKNQLQKNACDIVESLNNSLLAIARSDIFHGRNGKDDLHRAILRSYQETMINQLNEMKTYFENIYEL